MAVRNFWIETKVDGQVTTQAGGPKAKDGGFLTTVRVRQEGKSKHALIIEGVADSDTMLALNVYSNGVLVHTERIVR